MKKINLLFALLFVTSVAISQTTITVHHVSGANLEKEKIDDATIRAHYKFTQPIIVGNETLTRSDTLILDIGSKASKYYDGQRIIRDSLNAQVMKNISVANIKSYNVIKDQETSFENSMGDTYDLSNAGETAVIFKKRAENISIIIEAEENSTNRYICTENTKQEWHITGDTLTVLGYVCQKATTSFRGRNYNAWFSSEIPIGEGPWKFYGLPGLIMKVSDAENLFLFEIIALEHLELPVEINMLKDKYIKASRKDLYKLRDKKSGGRTINLTNGVFTMVSKANKNKYLQLETQ